MQIIAMQEIRCFLVRHPVSSRKDVVFGDAVHIGNFNQYDVFNSSSVTSFEFADGSTLTTAQLLARGFDLDGTAGDDTIFGTNTLDRINGTGGAENDSNYYLDRRAA